MSKIKTITVTVSKMVQLRQYEPFTVTVAEIVELETGDDKLTVRNETYASISKSVTKYINHEISKIADK